MEIPVKLSRVAAVETTEAFLKAPTHQVLNNDVSGDLKKKS